MSLRSYNLQHIIFVGVIAFAFIGVPMIVGCVTGSTSSAAEEEAFIPKVVAEGTLVRIQSFPKTYSWAAAWSVEYWDSDNQFHSFCKGMSKSLKYLNDQPQAGDLIQLTRVGETAYEITVLPDPENEDNSETTDSLKGPAPERDEQ